MSCYKKIILPFMSFSIFQFANANLAGHVFFKTTAVNNFDITSESDLYLTPSCLRSKGTELVILDPGHDDSSDSTRSDAKVRGGNGKYVILWPEVHEGKSNMMAAYLALEYALIHPSLSVSDRRELRTMIRLSRYPGEKYFGDWEQSGGYGSRGGIITSGLDNRTSRVNYMAANHRPFDSATQAYSKTKKIDVTSKSIMISVHANSSDYYDEGDLIWIIPPKTGADSVLISSLKSAFSSTWTNFLSPNSNDDSKNKALRSGALPSAQLGRIRTDPHSVNLAMLGSKIAIKKKTLLEGWVMNGKTGHLSYRDIKEFPPREQMQFSRSGTTLATYDATEMHKAYARAITRGLNKYFGCGPK